MYKCITVLIIYDDMINNHKKYLQYLTLVTYTIHTVTCSYYIINTSVSNELVFKTNGQYTYDDVKVSLIYT